KNNSNFSSPIDPVPVNKSVDVSTSEIPVIISDPIEHVKNPPILKTPVLGPTVPNEEKVKDPSDDSRDNTEYRRPELNITIFENLCRALIDTGASVSAISEHYFLSLKSTIPTDQSLSILPVTSVTISTAVESRSRRVTQQVLIPFFINKIAADCIFLVVPRLSTPMILGTDWLTDHLVDIRYSVRIFYFPLWDTQFSFADEGISVQAQLDSVFTITYDEPDIESFNNIFEQLRINTHLTDKQYNEAVQLFKKYNSIFRIRPGLNKLYVCKFNVSEDVPFKITPYPIPFSRRPAVEYELNRMLEWGVIERCSSPYSNPILCVTKTDGGVRLCLAARRINQIILPMRDSSPPLEKLLGRFQGNVSFSSIDFTSGYWQVPLHVDVRKFTAFLYNGRTYQFCVVPFGLNISYNIVFLRKYIVPVLNSITLAECVDNRAIPWALRLKGGIGQSDDNSSISRPTDRITATGSFFFLLFAPTPFTDTDLFIFAPFPTQNERLKVHTSPRHGRPRPPVRSVRGERPGRITLVANSVFTAANSCLKYYYLNIFFFVKTTSSDSCQHTKIIDTYRKLCENFTFDIEPSSPYNIISFWKRHININTQLLLLNKHNTIHALIKANFNEIVNSEFHDYTQIYTDASKNANVISDSLSVLLALESPNPFNEIIQQIHNILARSKKTIQFMWVPSHTGIMGNEKADALANEATASPDKKSWDLVPLSNKLKEIKKSIGKWHTSTNLSRREDIVTTRTSLGHTNLTHVHLIKHEEPPICTQCNEQLTIKHIILHCPQFAQAKSILNHQTTMETTLGEHNTHLINIFFKLSLTISCLWFIFLLAACASAIGIDTIVLVLGIKI
ncbi:Aspartic peptidase, active site,Ribonuclease H-like domain,Ribonuclease H domain,Aspartic peptidase, partial [Cinara cedri]